MYKICRTEQSYSRQRQLENGLLQLMLHKKYEDISISDLCQQMQIPRKSFYRYFSGKDGALYALIDHTLSDYFQMPLPDRRSRGDAVEDLCLFFTFWHEHRCFLDALIRNSLSGILVERANAFALRDGHLPQKIKSVPIHAQSIALSFAVCGLFSMMLNWHHQGYRLTPDEMAELAINMLTSPLLMLQ